MAEEDALVSQISAPKPEEPEPFDIKKVIQERREKRLNNSVSTTLSDPSLIETYSSPTLIPRSTYVMHGLLDIKKILRCHKRFLKRFQGNEALKKSADLTFRELASIARGIFRHHLQREYVIFRSGVGLILDRTTEETDPNDGVECLPMLEEFRIIPDLLYCREDPETDSLVARHKHRKLPAEACTAILGLWHSFGMHLLSIVKHE